MEALGRGPWGFALASVLLLLPCFWQSHIQAGDLSSHIYNAWLAQLVESGKTTGLVVVRQTSNVLVDLMLAGLLRTVGAEAAQRITVSLAVLTFAWGAFFFVSRLAGRRAWEMLPVIAILAYGWTFHMGFLNYYLSLGLCLFAAAAAWDLTALGIAAAATLLAVAYVAHGLPVLWTVALLAYTWIARRIPESSLPSMAAAGIGAIVGLRLVLHAAFPTRWLSNQLYSACGIDQAVPYDQKYWFIATGVLLFWTALLISLARREGIRGLFRSVPFHFALLTSLGIAILPGGVLLPGFRHALTYIAERMSLGMAICLCAAAAHGRHSVWTRAFAVGLALVYFGFLYRDDAIFNAYEDRMTAAVQQLRGKRVLTGVVTEGVRADPAVHMIDRACLGVCYSYANYEPTTAQFRVRALGPNPFVISDYLESFQMQIGAYVVKPSDTPIYRLDLDAEGNWIPRELPAGSPSGAVQFDFLR